VGEGKLNDTQVLAKISFRFEELDLIWASFRRGKYFLVMHLKDA